MNRTPLILAVETSGPSGSTALLRGCEVVREERFDPALRGGSAISGGVAELLRVAGDEPIVAVAAGIGPGSYTGTRVGLVYAKVFAFARGIPLLGICGLAAVAARPPREGVVAVALKAHETRVYGAIYDCQAGREPRTILAPCLIARDELRTAAGAGAEVVELPPDLVLASDVGRLAAWRWAASPVGDDAATLEPLYLQLSPPERKAASP